MTQQEAEQWANELVNELICYNKIKMGVKNIWAEKIISFLIDEKKDYNRFQNEKVIKAVPTMPADEGIGGLLEFIKNTNSVLDSHMLEDKKQDLSGAELKAQWKREFLSMSFNDQVNKATDWLTCGCPENAVPKFVMDWVKQLTDKNLLDVMRKNFKIGRDKWGQISGIDLVKGMNV